MENVKELLRFMLSLGEAVGLAIEDHEISLSDTVHFIKCLGKAGPAVKDIGKVMAELAALTPAQEAELVAIAREEFDIPQEGVETVVKDFIKCAVPTAHFIAKLISGGDAA